MMFTRGATTAFVAAFIAGAAKAQPAANWREAGPKIYMNTCIGCHMAGGEGVPGGFPPLAGHAIDLLTLKGGRDYMTRLALFGLQGPVLVNGKVFDSVMPGWAQLSDKDLASVLNYVVNGFGNDKFLPRGFKPFTSAEIKAARGKPMKPDGVAALRATMIPAVARVEMAPAATLTPAFTADQAARGRKAYESACIDCHGGRLDNGEFGGAPLNGSWFRNKWGNGSLEALFAFTKTKMPPDRPGTLNDQTYSELIAYILSENGYEAGQKELTADAATLRATSLKKQGAP